MFNTEDVNTIKTKFKISVLLLALKLNILNYFYQIQKLKLYTDNFFFFLKKLKLKEKRDTIIFLHKDEKSLKA